MALADAYATAAEYRTQTGRTGTGEDALILTQLTAVSRYLDKELGRPLGFNKDGSAQQRIYESPSRGGSYSSGWAESENPWKATGGNLRRHLDIDDHVSISAIEIDDDRDNTFGLALVSADYELLPRNATLAPEQQPYRTVMLTSYGSVGAWPPGARIRITGIGGWNAVPAAIKTATIELTAILRIESARATSSINEMLQVVSTSKAGQGIIADLKRTYLSPRAYL